ncbi:hypothetical protein SSOP1_0213 [Saccharolobus solfataricus]|uniref:Uncharacterized protein n=1 Tax=Saccharolobus solfataricus TaxID=2287 RepID=A0A157SX87_SACSO|nr:hypothetical protein SSOP1_0213 [Saccharolobus solfataricus]
MILSLLTIIHILHLVNKSFTLTYLIDYIIFDALPFKYFVILFSNSYINIKSNFRDIYSYSAINYPK